MKKYTIEIIEKDDRIDISRRNDGFSSLELIAFMEMIKEDLIQQFKGLAEKKVDIITKQAIKRD